MSGKVDIMMELSLIKQIVATVRLASNRLTERQFAKSIKLIAKESEVNPYPKMEYFFEL